MTAATRIYKHSAAGTDWAALIVGAGLGLTLALQMTTIRVSALEGKVLNAVLHRAAKAAGVTVSRVGAQPPRLHELVEALDA